MITVILNVCKAILSQFGLAGGGGSSSGGGHSSSHSSHSSHHSSSHRSSSSGGKASLAEFLLALAILFIFPLAAFVIAAATRRYNKKHGILSIPGIGMGEKPFRDHNGSSNSKKVHELAEEIFYKYQNDWSEFNLEGVKGYITPEYFTHASLMLEALKDAGRRNKVEKVKVISVALNKDIPDEITEPVSCRVRFGFSAFDEVIEEKTGKMLFKKNYSGISETWNFVFDGKELRLSGISQPTESAEHTYGLMSDFASSNKLFYSPDWGRYCLPDRGLIFDKTSLYSADVNNHIIGKWGDNLVQLYTYAPVVGTAPSRYYLVGQLNVPKEYLGIIVKHKKAAFKQPKDYQKFELEWGEFNDKYEVFASKNDALPAFELLEPQFMTMLYDKNLNYSIEVIGSAIYIFAPIRYAKTSDYKELLDVLVEAKKRLKQ